MNRLIIIGASGHGKVVADIAKNNGYTDIVFLDDNSAIKNNGSYSVIGTTKCIAELEGDVFVGIGNPSVRKRIMEELISMNRTIPTLVHPNAVIGEDVTIGIGSAVMAGAVINPSTKIGKGVILNTCSSVDHDGTINDYVHIAVGAHVCGTVTIGEETWIGAGATVSNNIDICSKCVIGAGAVVVKNIEESGTYVGVPARFIR